MDANRSSSSALQPAPGRSSPVQRTHDAAAHGRSAWDECPRDGAGGTATSAVAPRRLGDGHVAALAPGRHGLRVRCTAGSIWVTQAGSATDVVLGTGDLFVTGLPGKVVVQALSDATFRYAERV